jgi:hypothetical protein
MGTTKRDDSCKVMLRYHNHTSTDRSPIVDTHVMQLTLQESIARLYDDESLPVSIRELFMASIIPLFDDPDARVYLVEAEVDGSDAKQSTFNVLFHEYLHGIISKQIKTRLPVDADFCTFMDVVGGGLGILTPARGRRDMDVYIQNDRFSQFEVYRHNSQDSTNTCVIDVKDRIATRARNFRIACVAKPSGIGEVYTERVPPPFTRSEQVLRSLHVHNAQRDIRSAHGIFEDDEVEETAQKRALMQPKPLCILGNIVIVMIADISNMNQPTQNEQSIFTAQNTEQVSRRRSTHTR